MRILHINKFFDSRDGVDIYLRRLMDHQSAAGHEVHVLATKSSTNVQTDDAKYFIHRYDFSKSEGWKMDAKKATAYLWNREAEQMTERVIEEIRPDVIHLHNIYHHFSSSILGVIRRSGIHCVQTLHDYKLACPNYSMFTQGAVCERCKGGRYWNAIFHRCLSQNFLGNILGAVEMTMTKIIRAYEKTVHVFIAPSQFMMDKMIEWGEPASKFVVIRNPGDVSSVPAPRGGGYVLFAGRLHPSKGIDTLIRAMAEFPDRALRIAGTGPDEQRLKHIARSIGASNVSFLGFVPPSSLDRIRMEAECVAVPSVWYENSPLTVLEALGQGVPVIGSRVGGIPELIQDGVCGFLAEPGDVSSWVHALSLFWKMSGEDRDRMGLAGMDWVRKEHSWKGHLEQIEKVYLVK